MTDVVETVISTPKERIPKFLYYIGAVLVYTNAAYVTFSTIVTVVQIFELSLGLALVLLFTGVGFVFVIPPWIAWAGMIYVFEWVEKFSNAWEFWPKLIAGFLGVLLLPYIGLGFLSFIAGMILGAAGAF